MINPAGLRLTYAYDAVGQRNYLIEPEGMRFTYVYDAAGRISHLVQSAGRADDLVLRCREPGYEFPPGQYDPGIVCL